MLLQTKKLPGKIAVLVTDDNPAYRKILCKFLDSDERIEIVGQAGNGREAVKKALSLQPDVILMDMVMPVLN
jgi:two-component system chemotaxis response regulator CheB